MQSPRPAGDCCPALGPQKPVRALGPRPSGTRLMRQHVCLVCLPETTCQRVQQVPGKLSGRGQMGPWSLPPKVELCPAPSSPTSCPPCLHLSTPPAPPPRFHSSSPPHRCRAGNTLQPPGRSVDVTSSCLGQDFSLEPVRVAFPAWSFPWCSCHGYQGRVPLMGKYLGGKTQPPKCTTITPIPCPLPLMNVLDVLGGPDAKVMF